MVVIGIDIGGTKVAVSLGDLEGNVLDTHRFQTKTVAGAEAGLKKITALIGQLQKDHNFASNEIKAIGLSVPGPISLKEGKMLNPPNLEGWENVPIQEYFRSQFDTLVFMNNDANAGVLAEWELGKYKLVENLIYLTMSTGLGGGIISNGKLLQGGSDTAGEVGHFVLDPKGPKCLCGQKGCFEVFCGGKNLAQFLQRDISKRHIKTLILEEAEGDLEKIDMKSLASAALKKDRYALEIWGSYIEHLAQGIGMLLMTLNPDALILGTIATHTQELLLGPLKKAHDAILIDSTSLTIPQVVRTILRKMDSDSSRSLS